jgi:hypothetical protein
MSFAAVHLAENRKSRVNVLEIIYQARSLIPQLRDYRLQSLQVCRDFSSAVDSNSYTSLAAACYAGPELRMTVRMAGTDADRTNGLGTLVAWALKRSTSW